MPIDLSAAVKEVESLSALDEKELYARLGKTLKAREVDPSVGMTFDTDFAAIDTLAVNSPYALKRIDIGDIIDFFVNLGKRFAKNVNKQFLNVLCGEDEDYEDARERLKAWIDSGRAALLPGLITVLSGTIFGLAPAVAAIVAALLLNVLIKATTELTCELWEGASD